MIGAMSHFLLTGATGLLGQYLLRDLLLAGHQLTVVIRPTRINSVEDRLDRLLQHWQSTCGDLPRPKVIAGDITELNLGLSPADQSWVARNCSAVLHNAASLKFREADGEPWHSNLTGTRETLRFCEHVGISEFHYVSTAYVSGETDSTAYELPVDADVRPRNVYEDSKCQAERLVLDSDLRKPPTILRPSIIIGDSQTGFTSTFHGVYLPLRLSIVLIPKSSGLPLPRIVLDPVRILEMMRLSGQEGKNLVPVDWVSRMILRAIDSPQNHGRIYHLTSPAPIPVRVLTQMTVDCVQEAAGISTDFAASPVSTSEELDRAFCSQLSTYREYWADDPKFDSTNLSLIAADDPCPTVSVEMLRQTFRFALKEMSRSVSAPSRRAEV